MPINLPPGVSLHPNSSTRNRVQPTGDFIPLSVRAAVGQTSDLFVAYASDGTTKLARILSDGTISGALGSGVNVAGVNLTLAGGQGSGSAVGGDLVFESSLADGSGSSLNSLRELMRLSNVGVLSLTQLTSIQDRTAFDVTPSWATSTDASRKARAVINVYDTAAREAIRLETDGAWALVGIGGGAQASSKLFIQPESDNYRALAVKQHSSNQSVDLLQAQDSSANPLSGINNSGAFYAGTALGNAVCSLNNTFTANWNVLRLRANSAQALNILQVEDSGTNIVAGLNTVGEMFLGTSFAGNVLLINNTFTGNHTPLRVRANASQAVDIVRIEDASANNLYSMTNAGLSSFGTVLGTATVGINNLSGSLYALRVRAIGGQSVNIVQIEDSAGGALLACTPTGDLEFSRLSSSTEGRLVGSITGSFAVSADASRQGRIIISATDFNATREAIRIESNGSAAMLGVLGAAAVVQQAATADLKDSFCGFGFQVNGGATPMNLDGGAMTAANYATAIATKTANYTLTATDGTILADATTAGFSVTLPTAVGITGRVYVVKKIDTGSNAVTVMPNGAETIDGSASAAIRIPETALALQSDGAVWRII